MGTFSSPTLVTEMDLPVIDPSLLEMPHEQVLAAMTKLADDTWIARSLFGYAILSYADVTRSCATSVGTTQLRRSPRCAASPTRS